MPGNERQDVGVAQEAGEGVMVAEVLAEVKELVRG